MEVAPPAIGEYDTSKTFHLSELKITSRKFTSIKDRLRVRDGRERRERGQEKERGDLTENYFSCKCH